jgi:hypothetical protein
VIEHWNEGRRNGCTLLRELQRLGYRGSYATLMSKYCVFVAAKARVESRVIAVSCVLAPGCGYSQSHIIPLQYRFLNHLFTCCTFHTFRDKASFLCFGQIVSVRNGLTTNLGLLLTCLKKAISSLSL